MEISRKEKFGMKKKSSKKWVKGILATAFALSLGTTSAFAANPNLADEVYAKILAYTYKTDINNELSKEKQVLLKDMKSTVNGIFSSTKEELDKKKSEVIAEKKTELKTHYDQQINDITKRQKEAVDKKTEEIKTDAAQTTKDMKEDITNEIQQEVKKADINKK
ncbi:hypothetical protein KUV80_11365 [Fictibacillus nanhaiensis]|uniref:hypothetical protein n=1 Tax=Fictibacillus nanhaiensis TaxID=742169 RepID=UPI001C9846CE|nr:hypothetical protein [Fictibacillus nanhaiensis]MBY6037259.1 hypothetical protein [Fictibacillus nanhaiensis]